MTTTPNTTQTATTEINAKTCNCGCKAPVGKKSIYRPGHDAKHVSIIIDSLWNNVEWTEGTTGESDSAVSMTVAAYGVFPTTALQTKFINALSRKIDKEWSKYCTASLSKSAKIREQASCKFGWHPDEFYYGLKADLETATVPNSQTPVEAPVEEAPAQEISIDGGEIKVGRWTYPTGSVPGNDTIYRNTKRDGSGEWVEVN